VITDEEMAAAVVDSLGGVEHCAICWEQPSQYACREKRKDTEDTYAFCGGCVIRFRKYHNHLNTGQAMRALRFLAYKGWLNGFSLGQLQGKSLHDMMLQEKGFRDRWRN
jgi:hypothetical protein